MKVSAYEVLLRAVDLGNFSAVAKEMAITQSSVSKKMAALEKELGVQLFVRTTRHLEPTSECMDLYRATSEFFATLVHLKSDETSDIQMSGPVRLAASRSYGHHILLDHLSDYIDLYPKISLEIVYTEKHLDLVTSRLDLAIFLGDLPSSTLVARLLGHAEYKVVATEQYLEINGHPEIPNDLQKHACLIVSSTIPSVRNIWEFHSEQGLFSVNVAGPLVIDDTDGAYRAALNHSGIALIPRWLADSAIEQQELKWLLQDFYPSSRSVHIVYPQQNFLSRRTRSLIDFLVERLTS